MFSLPESEAQKIAIVLEETWAYEYKENRKAQNKSSGGVEPGLKEGFEEDFEFGDDDDNDYTDKMGLIEFWRKEEIRRGVASSVQSQ